MLILKLFLSFMKNQSH